MVRSRPTCRARAVAPARPTPLVRKRRRRGLARSPDDWRAPRTLPALYNGALRTSRRRPAATGCGRDRCDDRCGDGPEARDRQRSRHERGVQMNEIDELKGAIEARADELLEA